VRPICDGARTRRTPSAAGILRIWQNLSGRDFARSVVHRHRFAWGQERQIAHERDGIISAAWRHGLGAADAGYAEFSHENDCPSVFILRMAVLIGRDKTDEMISAVWPSGWER
jgi:hypothetical protein